METVYIETSIVSYLVADSSRDLVTAANQQITRGWWQQRRESFACLISQEVLVEASRGDSEQVRRRLEVLAQLPRVAVSGDAQELARVFLATGCLPPPAVRDAVHLAVATAIATDYLLTWNCRHLANAQILKRLEREAQQLGRVLPRVCTPLELMGELPYETRSDS
ncbi:MAG: type II toxin-antitoxin system VapC family toxin [Verrucomicrobia bacterium]|nr:type II toxin-antitoxin system VapC family toxin [Verrucomicrobiota bacterium]